jgi:hypothetical protein
MTIRINSLPYRRRFHHLGNKPRHDITQRLGSILAPFYPAPSPYTGLNSSRSHPTVRSSAPALPLPLWQHPAFIFHDNKYHLVQDRIFAHQLSSHTRLYKTPRSFLQPSSPAPSPCTASQRPQPRCSPGVRGQLSPSQPPGWPSAGPSPSWPRFP